MDNIYYLIHPRIDKTAVAYAPTTEKARTIFLDWLERNNFIRRANRHYFRKDMVAEKIEDPNVPCDTVLNYGYKDFSSRFEYERPAEPEWVEKQRLMEDRAEVEQLGDRWPSFEDSGEEEDLSSIEVGEEAIKGRRMPIQDVMLRGYVD